MIDWKAVRDTNIVWAKELGRTIILVAGMMASVWAFTALVESGHVWEVIIACIAALMMLLWVIGYNDRKAANQREADRKARFEGTRD